MKTMSTKVDEETRRRVEGLIEKGEFQNESEVLRASLLDFLRRRTRWKDRAHMKTHFEGRSEVPSGEIIDGVREEEEP